jgi:L-alanine-DL-glutamate epimerase-like enolase superfamily enzyme
MIELTTAAEDWALIEPFEIAGWHYTSQSVIAVTLKDVAGNLGRGEAAGVDYDGETPASMIAQLESVAGDLRSSLDVNALQEMLPKGGARNAIDCALHDLRAKQTGVPAWQAAGARTWVPLTSAFTLGLSDEAALRRKARAARGFPLLKLKVDAERHLDVVRIVREEHPDARLVVDANGAWSRDLLERLLPRLAALGVRLIEQPVAQGDDASLDMLRTPIPLAADESCRDRASLAELTGRYQFVNIKLDKCGGLTEGMALAREAARMGFGLMVGNMCGTSLAMAPAFVIGQACDYVDLDGPLLQQQDRSHPMRFHEGVIDPPEPLLWG